MSYSYIKKPGATKAILEALAADGGVWLLIDELVEELAPQGFTRGQIRNATSDLFTHRRGVQSDGRNPARYALNATAALAVRRERISKPQGEPLKRYAPGIPKPMTDYGLRSHMELNRR